MSIFNNITTSFNPSYASAFGTLETAELTPIFQSDFIYGLNTRNWNISFTFTITSPSVAPTSGAIYTNNNAVFICTYTSGTTFVAFGGAVPAASGTLTKVSGTGDATLTFSAFTSAVGVVNGTGATVDTSSGRLRIQSGTGSAGYAYLTSRKIVRYRAGMGTVVRFTPLFTTGVANNIQAIGIGSISSNAILDGFFFGYNGTAFGVAHYINGSGTWTAQASWNGDPMNGSGTSGITYNPINGTPVQIKYPFLGYGDIEFYIQNPTTASWILVHTIRYANTTTTIELTNPSLQFVGFTNNSGNTSNITMLAGSVGIFISGQRNFLSNPKGAADNNKATITTETNILTIKNCNSFNGVTNRGIVKIDFLSAGNGTTTNNTICACRVKRNATLGGTPSFAAYNGTTSDNGVTITSGNSVVSIDTAGTTIAGGEYEFNQSLGNGGTNSLDITPKDLFIAPGETMTFSFFATASATVTVSVNWSEDI